MDRPPPTELKRDIVAALALLLLALAYGAKAQAIPGSSLIGKGIGAGAVPTGLAIALAGFSLILLLRSARALHRQRREGAAAAAPAAPLGARLRPHARALGMLLIGIAFVSVLEFVGYALAIALLLAVTAWYNGEKRIKALLLFAAGGAIVYDLLFVHLLGVTLPAGIWPQLFAPWLGGD